MKTNNGNEKQEMISLTAVAKISHKGQITVPVKVRKILGVGEGDNIIFEVSVDGRVEIKGFQRKTLSSLIGILPARPEPLDVYRLRPQIAEEMAKKVQKKG